MLTDDLARVIDSQVSKVSGAVTDNTNANKAAWKILEKRYSTKFFHGCASHALNLLIKDVFGESKKYINDP